MQRLARDGASVVFSFAKDETAAAEVVAAVAAAGSWTRAVQADLGDRAAAGELFDTAEQQHGGLDIVVNNAGSSTVPIPISQTTDADYDQLMAVSTRAVFLLLREALTRLRDGGRIVSISTINTVMPTAATGVHAGSKAAVEQFTLSTVREAGARGITVNTVSPGATDTDLLRTNDPGVHVEQVMAPVTPLGRLGRRDDIADGVAFLAGPDARWLTGQNLRAGGGLP